MNGGDEEKSVEDILHGTIGGPGENQSGARGSWLTHPRLTKNSLRLEGAGLGRGIPPNRDSVILSHPNWWEIGAKSATNETRDCSG